MTKSPSSPLDGVASVQRLCRWLRAPDDALASARFGDYYALHRQPLMRMLEGKLLASGGESVREQAEVAYQELMMATCKGLASRHDRLLRAHWLLKRLELPTGNALLRHAFGNWRKEALLALGRARWIVHSCDDADLLRQINELNACLEDLCNQGARLLVQRLNEAAIALADSKGQALAKPGQIDSNDPTTAFRAALDRPVAERATYLAERFPGLDRPDLLPIRQSLCDFGEALVHLQRGRLPTAGYLIRSLDNKVVDRLREQGRNQISLDDWERSASRRSRSESDEADGHRALADDDESRAYAALGTGAGKARQVFLWYTIEKLLRRRQREIEGKIAAEQASTAERRRQLEVKLAAEVSRCQRMVNVLLLQAMDYGQEEVAALLRLSRDQVRASQQQGRALSLEILHFWLRHFRDLPAIQRRLEQWGPGSDEALAVLRAMFDGSNDDGISRALAIPELQVRRWRRRIGEVASDIVAGWIQEALRSRSTLDSVLRQLNADEGLLALRNSGKEERNG